MKHITFTSGNPHITEHDIIQLEKETKRVFPDSFKEFILKQNGGSAKEIVFTELNGNHHIISYFLPLLEGRNGSVKKDILLVNDERPIVEWLPFGFDPGGWVFCICLKDESYGKIHLFRMDKIYEENFDYVCESFEDFINGLRTEEEAFV